MSGTQSTNNRPPILGILGGMGPEATAEFFRKVIVATPAKRDQDHIHIVVNCDPSIPDRTARLLENGPDPLPALIGAGKLLAASGVTLGAMPCMTAHAFLVDLRAALPFPFLSAFEELARWLKKSHPDARRIGVLATTGSVRAGLYDRYLADWRVHYPDGEAQERFVMEAVYGKDGIKAGNRGAEPRRLLREAGNRLIARGADILVAGCTEIPLVFSPGDFDAPLLDPMQILAEAAVDTCLGKRS